MPKISELVEAESNLNSKIKELASYRERIMALGYQLTTLEEEYYNKIEPLERAVSEAVDLQNRHLSPWYFKGTLRPKQWYQKSLYHHRYIFTPDEDYSNPNWWDDRAWLRKMKHGDGLWKVTMNFQTPGDYNSSTRKHEQVILLGDNPTSWFSEADQILRDVGWILTE